MSASEHLSESQFKKTPGAHPLKTIAVRGGVMAECGNESCGWKGEHISVSKESKWSDPGKSSRQRKYEIRRNDLFPSHADARAAHQEYHRTGTNAKELSPQHLEWNKRIDDEMNAAENR